MSKSSKRPIKSWFNAKSAAVYRRERRREYTGRRNELHEGESKKTEDRSDYCNGSN